MNAIAGLILLAFVAQAGVADSAPRFEVATLRQSPPPEGDSYPITLGVVSGSRLNLTNVTLSDCIRFAYGLVSDDQIAGPDWIRSKAVRYDIVAVVPPDTPHEQLLLMTQSLLADRLKLVLHHEHRELRYLALVPGKNGPKMEPAVEDPAQPRNNSGGSGRLTGNRVSMALLATLLSRLEQQMIVDRTGLTGEFQVTLRWTPGTGSAAMASDETAAGASLFAAIQEQLGLRLESRKGPLDVSVVDRAERTPSEN